MNPYKEGEVTASRYKKKTTYDNLRDVIETRKWAVYNS